jgi:hypothetical protein
MKQAIGSTIEVQVTDLVLDPFSYHDILSARASLGQLEGDAINHLATLLPVAVAQLDAIGDPYGSLALAGLYNQLTGLETMA